MVITMFAVTVADERVRSAVVTSKSGNFLARSINQLSAVVPKELHEVLDPLLNQFNQKVSQPPTVPVSTESGGGAIAGQNGGGWNPWGASGGQPPAAGPGTGGAGGQGGGGLWDWNLPRNPEEIRGAFGLPRRSAEQGSGGSNQPR
jgi:hypothetical protein